MCKNLPVLNLPNEKDDLIFETDVRNEQWSAVFKMKEGEKLCKYCSGSFNNAKCNYPMMKKEILAVIRKIEKFLIFLVSKSFLIRTDFKWILGFVKNNLSNMQAQGLFLRWQLWFNQFSFSIKHIQESKNSLADILTRKFANGNHQSRPPTRKWENCIACRGSTNLTTTSIYKYYL